MAQADEDLDLDVDNTKKKGGSKIVKILIFTFLGILVIGLSVGVTVYLLKSDAPPAEEATATQEAEDKPKAEVKKEKKAKKDASKKDASHIPTYIEIKPKFVVNLDDPESSINFLQVAVTVVVYTPEEEELVKLHMPVIKHHLVQLFGDQKFNDLKTTEGKKELQQEALSIVQEAMVEVAGDETVTNLFITSIVGQ